MTIAESLLPEFDQEMANTRKVIARVPNGKTDWRPHPKSMPLGYMTVHISRLAGWVNMIMEKDEFDVGLMMKSGFKMPDFESAEKSVEVFDEVIAKARATLAGASDADFLKPWSLKNNGEVRFTAPKVGALRSMVFNHMIHHRGQLTVYLRLNDVPLPGLYGPTADEPL
jgi:uncharacterized damage-inducible protein DinB